MIKLTQRQLNEFLAGTPNNNIYNYLDETQKRTTSNNLTIEEVRDEIKKLYRYLNRYLTQKDMNDFMVIISHFYGEEYRNQKYRKYSMKETQIMLKKDNNNYYLQFDRVATLKHHYEMFLTDTQKSIIMKKHLEKFSKGELI